mgnify:CR=1 FL=1
MHQRDVAFELARRGAKARVEEADEVGAGLVRREPRAGPQLVLRPGADFSDEDFLDFLGQRLAKYKLPRRIEVLDELPKTAIGKIDKKVLEIWEQPS